MKAAVFKALGQPLEIESVPDPTPEAGEVVVKVGRCGICGSDLHMVEDPIFNLPGDTVLGHEYAGEIVATGAGVETLKKGDRVAVMPTRGCGRCAACLAGDPTGCNAFRLEFGGYAQYARASELQCIKLPSSVSLEDGALIEPLSVGLHGVNRAAMTPGDKVLVIGAGPIGLATIFWARRLGAGKIAATAGSSRRENLARQMGASVFVPPSEDIVGDVERALGGPPDIVFEAVGKPGLIDQSIAHARRRGTVVVLGLCTVQDHFMPFAMVNDEIRVQPAAFYTRREFEFAADVLDAGHVEPHAMITDTVSLKDMSPAFEALKERTHQCKVLVETSG